MTYERDPDEQIRDSPPLNMEACLRMISQLARDLAETRQEADRLNRQVQLMSENINILKGKLAVCNRRLHSTQ